MRLSNREWTLVGVSLLSVGLMLFLLVGTVRSDGPAKAAPSGTLVTERPAPAGVSSSTDHFRLTIDEQGLRGDWRDNKDSGSLRLDVSDAGVKIDARSTALIRPNARAEQCRCSCAHCDNR